MPFDTINASRIAHEALAPYGDRMDHQDMASFVNLVSGFRRKHTSALAAIRGYLGSSLLAKLKDDALLALIQKVYAAG